MKTPNLLEVPKDSPTRKERLEAFKKEHGIQTHDSGRKTDDCRWMAVLFDVAWRYFGAHCKEMSLVGLMAGACRLVDEAGLDAYGFTEMEAIRDLCQHNKIICPL